MCVKETGFVSSTKMEAKATKITDLLVQDVRFPTSLELDGSDASHPDPDYSAIYVTLVTDNENFKGYGISFTVGRGNEIVMHCVDSLRFLVMNKNIGEIQKNMGAWVNFLSISCTIENTVAQF